MYKFSPKYYFAPDNTTGGAIEDGSLSKAGMEEFLGKEDDTDLKLEEVPEISEEDSETGEKKIAPRERSLEDELEEELREPSEDETEELALPVPRKQVLAKYPNLFKDFPHLDKAVYREQKYSELLPTLRDAKIAVDKAQTLDNLSQEFTEGNLTTILTAIKQQDPEAFNLIVDQYFQNLRIVDKEAHNHLLSNTVKNIVLTMNKSEDKDIQTAAAILYKFMFNSTKFEQPFNLSNQNPRDEREVKLQEREVAFRTQELNSHVSGVNTRIDNVVKSLVDRNIDPKETMNSYVRAKAVNDCLDAVDKLIRQDTRFQGIKDKLWERSADSEYSQDSLDKIFNAYLSKAKAILPDTIRRVRNEAQKGLGTKSPSERDRPLPVGKPAGSSRPSSTTRNSTGSDKEKAKAIPKGMTSKEFLMKD